MGPGALSESGLRDHVFPLFSRVLERGRESGEIYLANHSLGRPMDAVEADVREGLGYWYDHLGNAWDAWMPEHDAHRARIAAVIGCGRADCVVPKTSAAQGLRAVLNAIPGEGPISVVSTRGEFDSIDSVLKMHHHRGRARVAWAEPDERGRFEADDLVRAIGDLPSGAGPKLVVVSAVYFVTGQVVEGLDRVIAAAHERGAIVVVDAYHAAGAVPMSFDDLGADFMIGGNYKYTRGGPGACWLCIHPRHLREAGTPGAADLATTDTGWFALADPFSYSRTDEPRLAAGGDAWLEATPPVLAYYQARAGLELTLALGIERLRAYNLRQQTMLTDALRAHGIGPLDDKPRGAFVPIATADGPAAVAALRARGVDADARPCPSGSRWVVRFCPDVLTTSDELARAAEIIASVLGPG